jgi:hypothetical protein
MSTKLLQSILGYENGKTAEEMEKTVSNWDSNLEPPKYKDVLIPQIEYRSMLAMLNIFMQPTEWKDSLRLRMESPRYSII